MTDDLNKLLTEMADEAVAQRLKSQSVTLRHLISKAIIQPPLDLEAEYTPRSGKSVRLHATIQRDGKVVVNGIAHRSLSLAASMAQQRFHAKAHGHERHQINGWEFWRFHDTQTGTLQPVAVLRRRYVQMLEDREGHTI